MEGLHRAKASPPAQPKCCPHPHAHCSLCSTCPCWWTHTSAFTHSEVSELVPHPQQQGMHTTHRYIVTLFFFFNSSCNPLVWIFSNIYTRRVNGIMNLWYPSHLSTVIISILSIFTHILNPCVCDSTVCISRSLQPTAPGPLCPQLSPDAEMMYRI